MGEMGNSYLLEATVTNNTNTFYLCIDLKSFYASVECVERGLDPMTTLLAVADPDRTEKTICLAITPAMKALGIKNRCRVFEIPKNIDYITAVPRMHLYLEYSARIYGVYLKYIAKEDIHVYSVDEAFLDVTHYLAMYHMNAKELGLRIMQDIFDTTGIRATCGIGTNLYLSKIALDILAKHAPDSIGVLDEEGFRAQLWDHRPITDFWRISHGTAKRLRDHGMTTLRHVAMMQEDYLYKWFGIDAELLIDHAWGREPTTIADIKNYKSKSKSLSSSQVLMRDYNSREGEVIVKEMMDQLCLDMAAKKLVTDSISLYVGYSHTQGVPGVGGTAQFSGPVNTAAEIVPAIATLYRRIVNPSYAIRRIGLTCNSVTEDLGALQLNMFEDTTKQLRHKALQEAMLGIRAKYGKNAILKGMNFDQAATGRERNNQIGGHKSNG